MERRQRILGVQREATDVVPTSGEDENTKYTIDGDIAVLLDEVLNNKTRAVMVFDDFSGRFSDFEMYQLSVVIKHNTSLCAITINGVDIGDESMGLLCQALIGSNVQYLDFTNTPLSEEAGSSLAALARCNRNVRTVVVTDTLVSEEMMDEVDVACMDNEAANDLPVVAPIDPNRPMYCVAHVFQACPNGDYCLLSHAPPGSTWSRSLQMSWDKALPPPPAAGATWRADDGSSASTDDDENGYGTKRSKKLKVNLDLLRRRNARTSGGASAEVAGRMVDGAVGGASQNAPTRLASVDGAGAEHQKRRRAFWRGMLLSVSAAAVSVLLATAVVLSSRAQRRQRGGTQF